jgi:hypothetical protein
MRPFVANGLKRMESVASPLEQSTGATAAGITGFSSPRQSRPSADLFFYQSWKKL